MLPELLYNSPNKHCSIALSRCATYLFRSSLQKSSCHVLKILRVFTQRESTVFGHTSPMKTSTVASPLSELQLMRS